MADFLRPRTNRYFWSPSGGGDRLARMTIEPRLDIIGAALADPSRARILCELMDGRAFTNKELACAAGISPQTASAHLKHLEVTGLTTSLRSGRRVYHRIATADVAQALEGLSQLSPTDHLFRSGQAGADTRRARSCYNHIAGRLGVQICSRLVALEVLSSFEGSISSGPRFHAFCNDFMIEAPVVAPGRAPANLCLDWTERQPHLSGPLATAILRKSLEARWLQRRTGSRALTVTEPGYEALTRWFGLDRNHIDAPSKS